ncbi:hypothetical protein ACP275_12G088200 [Erythranthe tilingii]
MCQLKCATSTVTAHTKYNVHPLHFNHSSFVLRDFAIAEIISFRNAMRMVTAETVTMISRFVVTMFVFAAKIIKLILKLLPQFTIKDDELVFEKYLFIFLKLMVHLLSINN